PSIIVDANVPTSVDPDTGAQITDTMSDKAIYVVWNTDWTKPDGSHDHGVDLVASEDQGETFSNVVQVGSGNHPVGFFTQGSAAVPGGILNIFADTDTDSNTNTSSVTLFQNRPDGGNADQPAVANLFVQGPGG